MAAELVKASPAFRASIEACAAALQRYGVDLMAEFAKPGGWSTPALAMSGLSAVQARLKGSSGAGALHVRYVKHTRHGHCLDKYCMYPARLVQAPNMPKHSIEAVYSFARCRHALE